jgi:hypothetical protein
LVALGPFLYYCAGSRAAMRMERNRSTVKMAKQRLLLIALLMSAGAMAAPTLASAAINVDIDVAPPVAQVETVPGPRAGYVWAPGYWEWRGHSHVWMRGHWIHERRGYHWVPDAWVQAGPHWHHARGHWER